MKIVLKHGDTLQLSVGEATVEVPEVGELAAELKRTKKLLKQAEDEVEAWRATTRVTSTERSPEVELLEEMIFGGA